MTVKIGPVGTITCELGDTINETMGAWFSNTGNFTSVKSGGPPPGVTFNLSDDTVKGTPTETGTWPVTFAQQYGDKVGKIIVTEVLTPATPGTPSADLAGQTYTIPDNPGAVWKADGVVVAPGVHPSGQTSYTSTVKVTLTVAPAAGYKFEGGTPAPVTYTFPVLPWNPPTHLYATVGEPVTITAGEVGAAGGCGPDGVDSMRFLEERPPAVPGLTPEDPVGGVYLGGWTKIAGTPTQAGEYTLAAELVQGGNSYGTYTAPLTVAASSTPPVDPEPEEPGTPGDPGTPGEHHPLSARVAAYVGRPDDPETLALADAQVPIVEAFVHGYTRGRGFKDGRPVAPLQAVVVTAAARLVTNPEQVYQYTTADYSERPAVLNGWTLPEQAVLHRYRRRTNRGATAAEASELNKLNAEMLAPYALTADVIASLSSYATLEDVPDLDPYALKSEIPAEPDLSGYALKSEIPAEPDLSEYTKTAGVPALVGLRRTPQSYHLPAGGTVTVPDSHITSSGSIFMVIDGDQPVPIWFQLYRAGTYNSCKLVVPQIATNDLWATGDKARPTTGQWHIWVEGNTPGAPLMLGNNASYPRNVRFYWFDI